MALPSLAVTNLRVFRLHLSVLLLCEWWGRKFLNHSNIETVLIKRQPGDSSRTTKPNWRYHLLIVLLNRTYWNISSLPSGSSVIFPLGFPSLFPAYYPLVDMSRYCSALPNNAVSTGTQPVIGERSNLTDYITDATVDSIPRRDVC